MARPKFVYCLLAIILCGLLESCSSSCTCYKNLGYTYLTAYNVNTNDTIARQIYYSTENFDTDQALHDSIISFYNKYTGIDINFIRKDSIYQFNKEEVDSYYQTDPFEKNGYNCECDL